METTIPYNMFFSLSRNRCSVGNTIINLYRSGVVGLPPIETEILWIIYGIGFNHTTKHKIPKIVCHFVTIIVSIIVLYVYIYNCICIHMPQ